MENAASRLSVADRELLLKQIEQKGEPHVRQALGISRLALARALAGLPVRAGTLALLRLGLPSLKPEAQNSAS